MSNLLPYLRCDIGNWNTTEFRSEFVMFVVRHAPMPTTPTTDNTTDGFVQVRVPTPNYKCKCTVESRVASRYGTSRTVQCSTVQYSTDGMALVACSV